METKTGEKRERERERAGLGRKRVWGNPRAGTPGHGAFKGEKKNNSLFLKLPTLQFLSDPSGRLLSPFQPGPALP